MHTDFVTQTPTRERGLAVVTLREEKTGSSKGGLFIEINGIPVFWFDPRSGQLFPHVLTSGEARELRAVGVAINDNAVQRSLFGHRDDNAVQIGDH